MTAFAPFLPIQAGRVIAFLKATPRNQIEKAIFFLSLVSPLGMLLLCMTMLLDMRRDCWDRAEQTASNLIQVVARDVERNIDMIDGSLNRVIENLKRPGIDHIPSDVRRALIFDGITTSRDLGTIFITDAQGRLIVRNDASETTQSFGDRDYFKIHSASTHYGLYVSPPLHSRMTGEPMVVISRRITNPDGSFGGIVASTLRASYFSKLFRNLNLDANDLITISHLDGTRIRTEPMRSADGPFSLLDLEIAHRYLALTRGRYDEVSSADGINRHVTFARIGGLPLVLDVGIAVDSIEGDWRHKAFVIGLVTLGLCALAIALCVSFHRELHRRKEAEAKVRRINAELEMLAATDGLTDLANRRRFDQVLELEWVEAARTGQPLSLLVFDADHFKTYNDRYGHQAGDEILIAIARSIAGQSTRPRDLPARIGGEEFAVILPQTDIAGARIVAERVRETILAQNRQHPDNPTGRVSVSCGIASSDDTGIDAARTLLRCADERLYQAKKNGRNRTCPIDC